MAYQFAASRSKRYGTERSQCQQRLCAPPREQETREPAERGEQHAFREQLPHDPRPARTERQTHGEFTAARRAASEEKIRDIGACDQQHQRDDAHDEKQGMFICAAARFVESLASRHRTQLWERNLRRIDRRRAGQRLYLEATARGLLKHALETRTRLLERRARLHPAHDVHRPAYGDLVKMLRGHKTRQLCKRQRDIDDPVNLRRTVETGRGHTDDRHGPVVYHDHFANRARVATRSDAASNDMKSPRPAQRPVYRRQP